MGEFFQQVHVWVVKNCTPWYMDGPDLIYRGTWMGHFSFKIGTWMGDGWWHFKIPRGTPLPRPKLSTPPPPGFMLLLKIINIFLKKHVSYS